LVFISSCELNSSAATNAGSLAFRGRRKAGTGGSRFRYSDVKPIIARTAIMLTLTLAGVSLACAQALSADQKPCAEPGDSSKSLSDKLDQGGGVICPPNVSGYYNAGAGDWKNAGDPTTR